MKINKQSLQARAALIAKEKGVLPNVIYARFFFDAFLSRLAVSPFKDHFVLKGGLYLSSLYGIDNRATIDIDFLLSKMTLERESLVQTAKAICQIDNGDGVVFRLVEVSPIRPDDLYGGFRLHIQGNLENVRQLFDVDVATGDPIVPAESDYDYQCLVTKENLSLRAYSLESVVAEKTETFLAKGIDNSRSKDLYDLYILDKFERGKMNRDIAKKAFQETCQHRGFKGDKDQARRIAMAIKTNAMSQERWARFASKSYASGISFEEVMTSVSNWLDFLMEQSKQTL
jgi:predicted nucleotidyltransferase component of viral defense system